MIIYQNSKIDHLFAIYGHDNIPTKQDGFKPVEMIGTDSEGNDEIIKEFYVRKPDNNSVRRFKSLLRETFINEFEGKLIKKPNPVEVILSFSLTEKRLNDVDIDNLSKTVLDAMNELVYEDDSQIVSLIASKHVHPMKINALFIGVTKITEERKGIGGDIRLFADKKF